ncbi:ankyrin repeat-containing domain protein [Fusarium oxysporum]|nr:ankyrin repeat-containing domain protein [Fusarium oxysporum]
MDRPVSGRDAPHIAAENKASGGQFFTEGQGDQYAASGEGTLYNHRGDNRQFFFNFPRGMPSLREALDVVGERLETTREDILNWLKRQPVRNQVESQNTFIGLRDQVTQGTGEWILATGEYVAWQKEKANSNHLAIQGHLGAGKSILLTLIIRSIQNEVETQDDMACVYFYFQESAHEQTSICGLWASLLQQLLHQTSSSAVTKELQAIFDSSLRGAGTIHDLTYFDLFKAQVSAFKRVYVIIDSLDYCTPYDNEGMRQTLSETFQRLPQTVRVLFSSRQPYLAHDLGVEHQIQVRPNASDVKTYVIARIKHDRNLRQTLAKPEDETLVISKITHQVISSQMFLLARLHLDRLSTYFLLPHLKKALDELPESLPHIFEVAIQKIATGQNSPSHDLAKHVFTMVIYGKQDLSVDEISEGFALSKDQSQGYKDWRPTQYQLLSACAGLIVLDSNGRTLRLVHHSVRESIERNGLVLRYPGLDIARMCLACLVMDGSAADSNPLLSYSANHWFIHLKDSKLAAEHRLKSLIIGFLCSGAKLSRAFTKLNFSHHSPKQSFEKMTGLHAVAYLDFPDWIKPLVAIGIDVNAQSADLQTPLHWAVSRGNRRVVKFLLDAGADPNIQDSLKDTPLHKFLTSLRVDGVEIANNLINGKADLRIRSSKGLSPLSSAIRYGPTSVASLFIIRQKDINAETEEGWTSLKEVFYHGHGVIEKLKSSQHLQGSLGPLKRAVKDHLHSLHTTTGWLALTHAAKHGSVTMLQKLLDNNKEENKSPLRWALQYRHLRAASLLIRYGADINEHNDDGWTPVIEATKTKNYDMVRFLINEGARLDDADADGFTPLMHSVKAEADVNHRDRLQRSALDIAISNQQSSIAWLLCEHGAEIGALDENRIRSVALLIDRGLTVNQSDAYGHTPLHYALILSYSAGITPLVNATLLNHGSNCDSQDRDGLTPLHYAAAQGCSLVLAPLVQKTQNIDLADNMGFTAVHHAVNSNQADALQVLRQGGADLDIVDRRGCTPLMLAAHLDNPDLVRLLLLSGANLNKRNDQEWSVTDLEKSRQNPQTRKIISMALRGELK